MMACNPEEKKNYWSTRSHKVSEGRSVGYERKEGKQEKKKKEKRRNAQ